jgi:hypothetical protein
VTLTECIDIFGQLYVPTVTRGRDEVFPDSAARVIKASNLGSESCSTDDSLNRALLSVRLGSLHKLSDSVNIRTQIFAVGSCIVVRRKYVIIAAKEQGIHEYRDVIVG